MTITTEQLVEEGTLLSLDHVRGVLAETEPMNVLEYAVGGDISFELHDRVSQQVRESEGPDPVYAWVTLPPNEESEEPQRFQLSKDGLLTAAKAAHISQTYLQVCPGPLIAPHLNFWYQGGLGPKDFKFLENNGIVQAVTRFSVTPFSNLRLLDSLVAGIRAEDSDNPVHVDSKFYHDLRRTHLRLVTPRHNRSMERTGVEDDRWSVGLQLTNSLTGEHPTDLSGYMFRYWCANGAIDIHSGAGRWSRRHGGSDSEEVYAWARQAVDEVFTGLEGSLDAVQRLADTPVRGDAADVLRELFERYRLPASDRDRIMRPLLDEESLTQYHIMNAITQAANGHESPDQMMRLMEMGGSLPRLNSARCDLGKLHLN